MLLFLFWGFSDVSLLIGPAQCYYFDVTKLFFSASEAIIIIWIIIAAKNKIFIVIRHCKWHYGILFDIDEEQTIFCEECFWLNFSRERFTFSAELCAKFLRNRLNTIYLGNFSRVRLYSCQKVSGLTLSASIWEQKKLLYNSVVRDKQNFWSLE